MSDPRYRLIAVAALSAAAYLSIPGALGAVLWWLCCTVRELPPLRAVRYLGVTLLLAAAATALTGGNGISYMIRISAVLLVATYAHASNRDGDLFDVGAWLGAQLGVPAMGFDLGLTAEIAIGSLAAAADDLAEIRLAAGQKGLPLLERWLTVGTAILYAELRRGRELSGLLALRGYRGGGTHRPRFETSRSDIVAAALAISVLLVAILASRDIFILSL